MQVFLNGQFVPRDDARVSAFDAGFQHAVGLFETMLARHGVLFRPRAHVDRLLDSARTLGLSEAMMPGPLVDAAQATVEQCGLESARVRLTVSGGDLNMLQSTGRSGHDPTVLVVAQPGTSYPSSFFEKGVMATIADARMNPLDPFESHKTLAYWNRIRALQVAGQSGGSEALWFTVSNHLACGSVSNAFVVRDGVLYTPPARGEEGRATLPSPVRPGVTRAVVLEMAGDAGIEHRIQPLGIEEVLGADEVFLTNSGWGVLPIAAVEKEPIGAGAVGPVTRRLRQAWLDCVDEETAGSSPSTDSNGVRSE